MCNGLFCTSVAYDEFIQNKKEIEILGGDVYFGIDGKNVWEVSLKKQIVDVMVGEHTVKMYKSRTFDTFIGFAESTINVTEDERRMIKYSTPMMINQPGNMVISEYMELKEQEVIRERDYSI